MLSPRKILVAVLAATVVFAAVSQVGVSPAAAQMGPPFPRHGGYHGGPRHYGGPGYYHGGPRYHGRRDHGGDAAAAGIFGFVAGAMIGSALQQRPSGPVYYEDDDDAIAACARRYRSYDVRTQTYRGYDGRVYACP